jgi:hypothetical protein
LPINGSSAASDVAAARQTKQSNRIVGFSIKRSSSISAPRMDASSDNRESRLRKPAHKSNNPVTFGCRCLQSPPKRFPSPRCASAIPTVRPCASKADTQPQLQPALLRLSAMISQYLTRASQSPLTMFALRPSLPDACSCVSCS